MQKFVITALAGLLLSGCATSPALHVIGVYEGGPAAAADGAGEVAVNVSDNSRPLVLALMAYEKTLWRISLTEGVQLDKVILAGYHSQSVAGLPPAVPIETYTYDPSPCERCVAGPKYFYSYTAPPPQLQEITRLQPKSFQSRYQGADFSIFPGLKGSRADE